MVRHRSRGNFPAYTGFSPGHHRSQNERNDLIKKKRVYHRHEVGHYWIVDPAEETLAVYRWHPDGFVEVLIADRSETVPPVGDHEARRAEPFESLELRVGVLFGDDEDEE